MSPTQSPTAPPASTADSTEVVLVGVTPPHTAPPEPTVAPRVSIARIVSLSVLVTLIVVLGLTFFQVVAPFFLPLFIAAMTALLCQPIFHWFLKKTNNRIGVSAGLTTFAALVIITIPLVLGTLIGVFELYRVAVKVQTGADWPAAAARLQERVVESNAYRRLQEVFPDLPDSEAMRVNVGRMAGRLAERTLGYAGAALDRTLDFVSGALALIIAILTFILALYYFLADGPALIQSAEQLIPVQVDYQRHLRKKFDQVVRAVVLSTFLAAIVQGVLTASMLWVAGFHRFFMLAVMSTLSAMIPLAGTWLIWAPCAGWLAWNGDWFTAGAVAAFGIVVIGLVDNAIRTWVLNSDARLHPLLAFISVLGGLQMMGLWGMFVGPIVATCLHALAQIFNFELKEFSRDTFGRRAFSESALNGEAEIAVTPATVAPNTK
ncbi:MAG: AI-2E family transporter [Planctomycetaceae bacterium]|nr:AI-2E family transporter [Planctomycetaceae bacterium]